MQSTPCHQSWEFKRHLLCGLHIPTCCGAGVGGALTGPAVAHSCSRRVGGVLSGTALAGERESSKVAPTNTGISKVK